MSPNKNDELIFTFHHEVINFRVYKRNTFIDNHKIKEFDIMRAGETAAAFGVGFVSPAVILYGVDFAVAGPAGGSAAAWIQSKQFSYFQVPTQ